MTKLRSFKSGKIGFSINDIIQAVFISAILITIYYYWFAVADRKILFLYDHYGWGAFHHMTRSRYWMTGLMVSSFLTIIYVTANYVLIFIFSLIKKQYSVPHWYNIWIICLPAIFIGIPFIVMNFNTPVMPFPITFVCVITLIFALALGLYIGNIIITNIKKFLILSIDGLAIVPPLILMIALELPAKSVLNLSYFTAIGIVIGSIAVSFSGMLIFTYFYKWRKIIPGKNYEIFLTGLYISYFVLPLMHYLYAAPPGRPYITTSDNFFPDNTYLKILTWLTVILLITLIGKIRKKILIN